MLLNILHGRSRYYAETFWQFFNEISNVEYKTPEIKLLSSLPTIRKEYGVFKSFFMRISISVFNADLYNSGGKQTENCVGYFI